MAVTKIESEEAILKALEGSQGDELLRKLASVLAAQERRIEELAASLQLLTIYEKHGGAQLSAMAGTTPHDMPAPAPRYASSYEVSASDYLLEADGFHAVEYGNRGLAFRWAAITGTMRFTFYVDRSAPLAMELVFFNSVNPANYEKMMLVEGDTEVPIARADVDGQVRLASVLPAKPFAGETNLILHIPYVRRLGAEDARVAGVAFHKLTVGPQGTEG